MKFLIAFAVSCLLATAHAQVRCLNPGSMEIPASPCCDQVAGQGLGGALGDMMNMMDLVCKVNMFFDAVLTDADMLDFFNYITGPEFGAMIISVTEMQEFRDLMYYLCENLQLDGYLYLNTLADILGIPRIPHHQGGHCHPNFPFPWAMPVDEKISLPRAKSDQVATPFRSGVRRFMDDIHLEIPGDDIYNMWLHKVAYDPYLCLGYLKLSSVEFRAIVIKLEYHPEFIRFVMKLEEWGLEMNQWMDDLKDFIWYSPYCR